MPAVLNAAKLSKKKCGHDFPEQNKGNVMGNAGVGLWLSTQ